MTQTKTIIVTGAAKGIGRAICETLIARGFFVAAVDLDATGLDALVSDFGNDKVAAFVMDICKEDAVKNLFADVCALQGSVYGLVNNAGIIRDNMIWNMTLDDFDAVINVNLRGTWLMCREAAMHMKTQPGGRIVNIASRAWLGNRGQSNYSASKAGVVALTRVLALELGKYKVNVNAIAPGLIDTPLTQKLEPSVLQKLIDAQPSRSMGAPKDVANAVAFLVSPDTEFVTGQTLYVDGGKSIGANM